MRAAGLAELRVLLVEDEYLAALDIEAMLIHFGCTIVDLAPRVDMALLLRDQAIDLATLNVKIGDELVYPVAQDLLARGIPFLFVTGYDRASLPTAFKAVPYVPKPVDAGELRRQVTRLVRPPPQGGSKTTP